MECVPTCPIRNYSNDAIGHYEIQLSGADTMGDVLTFPCQFFVATFFWLSSIFWTFLSFGSDSFGLNLYFSVVISISFALLNVLVWTHMEYMGLKPERRKKPNKNKAYHISAFQAQLLDHRQKQQSSC